MGTGDTRELFTPKPTRHADQRSISDIQVLFNILSFLTVKARLGVLTHEIGMGLVVRVGDAETAARAAFLLAGAACETG